MSVSVKGLNLIYISQNHKHIHVKKLEIIFKLLSYGIYGAERVKGKYILFKQKIRKCMLTLSAPYIPYEELRMIVMKTPFKTKK